MDGTDVRILNLLQADSRITLRRIGEQVGLTPPSVAERIRKMEDDGIICRYRIDIDRTKLDYAMVGYILVAPEPDRYAAFCAFCREQPAITEHHHVIGPYNAILRFAVRDTEELDALLSRIKTYGDSRTSVELKTLFEAKDLPLSKAQKPEGDRKEGDAERSRAEAARK